ncbi:hypothetical protein ACJJI5_03385 [Microbulbifer sp. EKSA008]|uniref:hypothetical protein n=1 Tax=unclassified Microbulbifer TaxID=2619833 RepID=UPI00403A346F
MKVLVFDLKKLFIFTITLLLALAAYYLTFTVFYESWFPYYYEEYLSYFFLAGLAIVVLLPFAIASTSGQKNGLDYLSKYANSATKVHLAVVILSVLVFVYMMSNGVFLDEAGIYQVVPSGE